MIIEGKTRFTLKFKCQVDAKGPLSRAAAESYVGTMNNVEGNINPRLAAGWGLIFEFALEPRDRLKSARQRSLQTFIWIYESTSATLPASFFARVAVPLVSTLRFVGQVKLAVKRDNAATFKLILIYRCIVIPMLPGLICSGAKGTHAGHLRSIPVNLLAATYLDLPGPMISSARASIADSKFFFEAFPLTVHLSDTIVY